MKKFTILLLLSLSGCQTLGLWLCEKVSYDREGNQVVIYAECEV